MPPTTTSVRIHETTAAETIVVEMRGVGRAVTTGSPFEMAYVAVVTVRDGLFRSYRDYWNPLAAVELGVDLDGADAVESDR